MPEYLQIFLLYLIVQENKFILDYKSKYVYFKVCNIYINSDIPI